MSSDPKAVRTGRLGRLARVAALGARTGVRRLQGGDAVGAAEDAVAVLGELRGLAAKMGQMASYVDGFLPEGQRDDYARILKKLQTSQAPSSPEAIRQVMETELGAPVSERFADWDPRPIASASIGQVHLATMHDGRSVAVKVQHPGIERALDSDLSNVGMMKTIAGLTGLKNLNPERVMAELNARFREELDYVLEADRQRHFAAVHAGDPHIRIPAVVDSHSTRRVLTTELVEGQTFEDACSAPVSDRITWAEAMWRFVFKGNFIGGMFNADPHPGNYIFHPGGAVTFIDFGCVQTIDEERRPIAAELHRVAIARDRAAFVHWATEMARPNPGRNRELVLAFFERLFRPLLEAPFRITRAYNGEVTEGFRDIVRAARRSRKGEFAPLPSGMVLMNRLTFGFYSVLARLDVEVDYAAVEAAFLDHAPRP